MNKRGKFIKDLNQKKKHQSSEILLQESLVNSIITRITRENNLIKNVYYFRMFSSYQQIEKLIHQCWLIFLTVIFLIRMM